ncbi:MAG: hypothetical protein AB7P99_07420 [Vicinamibacterales bacterium]
MQPQHRDLAGGRWYELALAEQLGHVGSEVSRAVKWTTRNPEVARGAWWRALELLQLTLDDPRLRRSPARLREVARAREVVADFFAGSNQFGSTSSSIQKYFDSFAVAASRVAGR